MRSRGMGWTFSDVVKRLGRVAAFAEVRREGLGRRGVIEAREREHTVELSVRDDGDGFDPATSTAGFGLLGMRERVQLLHGTIQVASSLRNGATVTASFPVQRLPAKATATDSHPIRTPGAARPSGRRAPHRPSPPPRVVRRGAGAAAGGFGAGYRAEHPVGDRERDRSRSTQGVVTTTPRLPDGTRSYPKCRPHWDRSRQLPSAGDANPRHPRMLSPLPP